MYQIWCLRSDILFDLKLSFLKSGSFQGNSLHKYFAIGFGRVWGAGLTALELSSEDGGLGISNFPTPQPYELRILF